MRHAVQERAGIHRASPPPTASLHHLLEGAGGLDVAFQPLFELRASGPAIHAVEGFIRGPKGTRLERPEPLFAFFLRRGEGRLLDALCLSTILQRAATLPGALRLCVNVAAESVAAPGFLDEILRATDRAGVSPYRLILDISLDDDRFDQTRLVPAIREMRRFGIRPAYDEGSPFVSGFELLMDAPPDYLKLHGNVVRTLAFDTVKKTVAATVSLGQRAGFRVVAKGVETASDLEAVRDAGVDLVQGFHFGPPVGSRDTGMSELLRSVPGAWDEQWIR